MSLIGLGAGAPVVLQLHSPKEKVWGILLAVDAAGIILRGLDLEIFDDWMRQEAHGDETMIAPSTIFYPMGRVVRLERDESFGPVVSYADRFAREVGRTAGEAMGLETGD